MKTVKKRGDKKIATSSVHESQWLLGVISWIRQEVDKPTRELSNRVRIIMERILKCMTFVTIEKSKF